MKVEFTEWRPDELIPAYLLFIKLKNSKEVHVSYTSDKYGFSEQKNGKLDSTDERLKKLAEKIQFTDSKHELILHQKNWKVDFRLDLRWEHDFDAVPGAAVLTFDDSLRKEVMDHFEEFSPEKLD